GELNTTFSPAAYTDLRGVTLPLSPGAVPFAPVPLTSRTLSLTGFTDKLVNPYIQSINLSIQREMARNLTVEVGYIGSKSTKLYTSFPINTTNVFENGILDAFNLTRAGGNAPLMDRVLNGLNVTGVG